MLSANVLNEFYIAVFFTRYAALKKIPQEDTNERPNVSLNDYIVVLFQILFANRRGYVNFFPSRG